MKSSPPKKPSCSNAFDCLRPVCEIFTLKGELRMMNGDVIFETDVVPKEGTPYLATGRAVHLMMTTDEIRLLDPQWRYVIPIRCIYDCAAKPLPEKRVVCSTFSAPSTVEIMNNYLLIDYRNEFNQRAVLRAVFLKYFMIKSNVAEAIRFNETIERYRLRDLFIKDLPSAD